MLIAYEIAEAFGGADGIAARVAAFRQALADHALTVDVPVPRESVLIENIVRYNLAYEVEPTPPPPPPPAPEPESRRLVSKALIIDRLVEAGKADAAFSAFDAMPRAKREKWNARSAVYFDDPDTIALLNLIGADPSAILAPMEDAA